MNLEGKKAMERKAIATVRNKRTIASVSDTLLYNILIMKWKIIMILYQ